MYITWKLLLHPVYRDDTDENIKSWNERGGGEGVMIDKK